MSRPSTQNPGIVELAGRLVRSGSVERKLRAVVMVATGAALLLVAVGVASIDVFTARRQLIEGLTIQAAVVADGSVGVLAFREETRAAGVLETLRHNPRVEGAALYTGDGRLFAGYERHGKRENLPREVPLLGMHFKSSGIEVTRPVTRNGRTEGYLWLRSDLEDMQLRLRRYVWLAALLLPLSFAAAAWLGSRLQRSVTEPILRLSESMKAVSERKDYTIRAERGSDDEVGQLMDGFNRMLQRIGEQDAVLKAERSQLALRVEERTSELRKANEEMALANQRLQVAMARAEQLAQAAEAASRSKSEFLAAVSHELRTPMNGVIGFTNLLLDTPLAGEQREFAEIIRNSGHSLLTLINDILDFSKIEAGKMVLERLPFDPAETIAEVAELLGPRADEKGLEVVVNLHPDLPSRLFGDPARVRQVLLNLLGNAVKFTDRGHILIEAGPAGLLAGRHPGIPVESARGILICVTDTGIGIAADKQGVVFDRFTQADSSTTRRYGGTGLGLAISRRLTELMGGSIGVVSEAGQGSTFWFTLVDPTPVEMAPEAERSVPDLRGLRVLVVDDVEVNRRVLRELLRGWGAEHEAVDGAEGALEALERAAAAGRPFQVALLDYLMPGMDGLALGRRIRELPALTGTRLVMITSGSQRTEAAQFRAAGFSACLIKPLVRPRLLAETIDEVLREPVETPVPAMAGSMPDSAGAEPRPPEAENGTAMVGAGGVPAAGAGKLVEGPKVERPRTEALPVRGAILLAEDNRTNQLYATRLLQKMGWRVDVVENGVEAVAQAMSRPYRLILMDCQMPEMNGYDAAGEIRRRSPESRVPIVALTAHALVGERERCLAAGMDDYLAKPFQRADLERILEQWAPGGPAAQL